VSFINTADLADSASFKARVKVTVATVAVSVWAEDATGMSEQRHDKRLALARAVLASPQQYADLFVWPVLANVTIAQAGLDATDGDLQYQVGQVWDAMAGVTAADLQPPA